MNVSGQYRRLDRRRRDRFQLAAAGDHEKISEWGIVKLLIGNRFFQSAV